MFVVDVLEFLSVYFGVLVHILAVFISYLYTYLTLFKCITIRSLVMTFIAIAQDRKGESIAEQ